MTTTESIGAREGLADRASTAVEASRAPRRPTLASQISQQQSEIERALPTHLKHNAEAFVRAAITVCKQTPALAKCDPVTILGGLMTASSLGLELGPLGHAYLVPYGNKAQLIIGYKGIIDLAWRSDRLTSIEARAVKQNDHFEFSYGLEPKLVHTPTFDEPGPTIAYYGKALFKGGGSYFVVMSKHDIETHRKRSKSSSNGPWQTDYDAMACKTCIRVMQPYLPLTSEVARQFAMDGTVSTGVSADNIDVEHVDYIDADEVEVDDNGEVIDGSVPLDAQ